MTFGARARIRLSAIRHNFQALKDKAPATRVMAVVKGNAYGHGLVVVARTLADADTDSLAVARLSEAIQLREAGIDTPLVLLGGVLSRSDLAQALALGVAVCVHNDEQVRWLEEYDGTGAIVWLKIDTGMNRLGFRPEDAPDLISRLGSCSAVTDLHLMTHFANADDPNDATTCLQFGRFLKIAEGFKGDVSVANSAALLGFTDAFGQLVDVRESGRLWIRPGISLYGVSPLQGCAGADLGLHPAMRFESKLFAVKSLRAGDRVGYGGTWQSARDTVLGVVSVGYGDGYPADLPVGTPLLINGRRVPVVGRISMDLTTVDLGAGAADRVGDTVILWSSDLPVELIAEYAGTTAYRLVTGLTHREAPSIEA